MKQDLNARFKPFSIQAELASGWDLGSGFLYWARSKNPENPEIPGIGIGV